MVNRHTHPEIFQGQLKYQHYFEGWYFKHTSTSSNESIAFIPGVSLNPDDSHAFIQVIQSHPVRTYYFTYPLDCFDTTDSPFSVTIGDSFFSLTETNIDITDGAYHFKGQFFYDNMIPIDRSLLTPNIMGFFSYIPKMACKHGVISMHHQVNGTLTDASGHILTFKDDHGYIEKDWGHSFPEKYIWSQANHFPKKQTSLMVSVATIPLLTTSFIGHLCHLHLDGKDYRFATYNGSKITQLKITDQHLFLILTKNQWRLKINAWLDDAKELKAPLNGAMTDTIKEGLGGTLDFKLYHQNQLIHVDSSPYAGIEVVNMTNINAN